MITAATTNLRMYLTRVLSVSIMQSVPVAMPQGGPCESFGDIGAILWVMPFVIDHDGAIRAHEYHLGTTETELQSRDFS
jgi:hypothetical protein